MIALGSNVHIFARPHRRGELARYFETVLGSPVRTVELPGIDQPMIIVSFPGGGHLSSEFTSEAPDDEQPRLGAWLELRADDPAAVHRAALEAGLTDVKHPGHPYYFMIPGGQVFTIAPSTLSAAEELLVIPSAGPLSVRSSRVGVWIRDRQLSGGQRYGNVAGPDMT